MNVPFSCGNGYAAFMRTLAFARGLLGISIALAGCTGGTETIPSDAGADGSTVILDGGGDIPSPPDGESACPQGACNYQSNMGCTGQQTCFPTVDGNGQVVPTCQPAGAVPPGGACAAQTDCGPGSLCVQSVCRKLCCGGDWTGCNSDTEHCIQGLSISNGNGGTVASGAMLCLPIDTCDALDPESCPLEGQSCLIVDPTGATACVQPGTGEQGDACPCKGGFLCVAKECRRLCKAVEGGGEPGCEAGEGICVHYNRDPQGVGECTPTD